MVITLCRYAVLLSTKAFDVDYKNGTVTINAKKA